MTRAILEAPTHPGEQVECFEKVSKNDHDRRSSAE